VSAVRSDWELGTSGSGSPRPACAICCDGATTWTQRFGCYNTKGAAGVNLSDSAGAVPGVVPFDLVSGWPADPGYSAAIVTVPYALWKRAGDLTTANQSFDAMSAYADHLLRHTTDGLVQFGMLGDWLSMEQTAQRAPGVAWNAEVPRVSAFSGALSVAMVAEMAEALGKSADAIRFGAAAWSMRDAYHRAYYVPSIGAYGSRCSQAANLMPLVLGCVPDGAMPNVSHALVQSLQQNCTGRSEPTILTGGVGTRYIFEALVGIGHEALALQLAMKESSPSFGYMVNQGPSTLWEFWNGTEFSVPRGSSKNHHMLSGGVGLFLLDVVGGLRAEHGAGGRAELTVRLAAPVVRTVRGATTSVESAAGRATLDWSFADELQPPAADDDDDDDDDAGEPSGDAGIAARLLVNLLAPSGLSRCSVHLPLLGGAAVLREGGQVVWTSGDGAVDEGRVAVLGVDAAGAILSMEVGAGGEHRFELEFERDELA
jgi:hypothetical protein